MSRDVGQAWDKLINISIINILLFPMCSTDFFGGSAGGKTKQQRTARIAFPTTYQNTNACMCICDTPYCICVKQEHIVLHTISQYSISFEEIHLFILFTESKQGCRSSKHCKSINCMALAFRACCSCLLNKATAEIACFTTVCLLFPRMDVYIKIT